MLSDQPHTERVVERHAVARLLELKVRLNFNKLIIAKNQML